MTPSPSRPAVAAQLAAPPAQAEARHRGELRFVAALVTLALLISSAPLVYGYLATPPDKHFVGVVYDVPDHAQYFAWMRDLARENLAPNRLTPEPNAPAFFNLLWWGVGRLGAFTGLDYAALWALLRILAALALLGAGYAFIRVAAPHAQRRLAFGLFAFGGGLGVVWVAVKYLRSLPDAPFPFDIYTAEPNTFFILMAFPHFGLALASVIAMLGLTLTAYRRRQLRYALAAGAVGFTIGLQHAYDLITVFAVIALFGLLVWLRDRRFPAFLLKSGALIAALSAPPAAYLSALVLTDPTWGRKLEQFDNAGAWTPLPWHLPILLGAPFLLALLAFRPKMLRSRDDAQLFTAAWFVAHFPLVYLPVKFQIHLLLGWQVPIAILAAGALLTTVRPWLAQHAPALVRPTLAALLGLCMVTNVYITAWRVLDFSRHTAPYYLTQDEVAALRWLGERTTRADVVLADLEFGQNVPVWSDARAFLSHWAGTLDFFAKRALAAEVLDPATPPARRAAILDQYAVTYVVARPQNGPPEVLAASSAGQLTQAFRAGDVTIFRVRKER
ncbi:MAG TPA: hypothetical protein VNL77_06510 [Roseiflexaceae bacterium]|nr:hypothetical protein [Roseiflexaceae bacterium]